MADPRKQGRRPRLPRVDLAGATAAQREVIAELLAARGKPNGRLANLYAMLVHQPEVARRLGATGAYCRFHATPAELVREAAILTACDRLGFDYEIAAHEEIIRHRGLSEEQLAALRDGRWDTLPGDIALGARFVRETLSGSLTDETVSAVVAAFSVAGLLDLTLMAAHYSALSVVDRVLQPDIDPLGHSLTRPQDMAQGGPR